MGIKKTKYRLLKMQGRENARAALFRSRFYRKTAHPDPPWFTRMRILEVSIMSKKYLYYFSEGNDAFAGDKVTMKNILGGKGAGLAEMTALFIGSILLLCRILKNKSRNPAAAGV